MERTSGGTFSVLHAFLNSTNGEESWNLHMDSSGNFIRQRKERCGANSGGTLWKQTSGGTFSVCTPF